MSGAPFDFRALAHTLFVALFIALSWQPAAAQAPPLPGSPPTFSTIDENGVNLASGSFNLSMQDVSVGQPGSGGLAFTRIWIGTGWRYNHIGTINSSGAVYTVSIGASSETFTLASGVYASDQAMGSTLTEASGIYTYTLRDGTVALFATNLAGGGMAFDANVARLTQITGPNGERLTYTYKSVTVQSVDARRLQSVTNNLGYQLHLDYANDNPTTAGDLPAWKTLTSVTAINNATDYCDPAGDNCTGMSQTWPAVTYSVSGSYETITDALGRATRITYNGSNQITAIRRPTSTTTDHLTYTYTSGRVTNVSNGSANWQYSYTTEPDGSILNTMNGPESTQRIVRVDTSGRVTLTTIGGVATTYEYDASERLTKITQEEGNYTTFAYDARGNVTSATQVAKSGSGLGNIVTSASFPGTCTYPASCNQPTATTDANGNVTDYTYDSGHGGVLTVTLPDPDGGGSAVRPQTRFSYSSLYAHYNRGGSGIVDALTPVVQLTGTSACATTTSCAAGADETVASIAYGSTVSTVPNNLLPVSGSSGAGDASLTATVGLTYDTIGNLITIDGPLSGSADTTTYRYDAARQTLGVIGPDPDGAGGRDHPAVRVTYNLDGQTTRVEQGTTVGTSDSNWAAFTSLQQTDTTYDFIGRATLGTLSASGTTYSASQMSYDGANRLTCSAVRMNASIFGSLPSSACTLGTEGANGPDRITRATYNSANQVTQLTRGYATAAAVNEWSATYTDNGLMATLTDAGGNVYTYEYDGFDRLRKLRFPNPSSAGSSTTDYEQYTYDTTGNPSNRLIETRRRDAATIAYAYDNLDRVTSITPSANGAAIGYAYDNFSRATSASAASRTLSYTYDQLSRVLSEAQPQGTMSYQWDVAGRRTRVTWPDPSPNTFYVQYDYDLTNAVTAIRENGASSGAGVLATYTYDPLGRRTGVARGNGTSEVAAFDTGSPWLTDLTQDLASTGDDLTLEFAYNAAGGIVSRNSSNSAYDWSPPSPSTTSYADNNLNQYTNVGGTSQTYDARGNLTTGSYGYDIFNRLISGPSSFTAAYDPSGRLYETTGGTTTRFLYDGAQLVGEYNASGTLQRRYVPGASIDTAVTWYEGSNTSDRRWLIPDERGSVIAYATGAGAAGVKYTYDEYGQPNAWSAPSAGGSRFRYTGQAMVPDAQLYHYRARAYSPAIGRFLQTDPILHQGGINVYAYVANNPMNNTDAMGLQDDCQGDGCGDDTTITGDRCARNWLCSALREHRNEINWGLSTLVEWAFPSECEKAVGDVLTPDYIEVQGQFGGVRVPGTGVPLSGGYQVILDRFGNVYGGPVATVAEQPFSGSFTGGWVLSPASVFGAGTSRSQVESFLNAPAAGQVLVAPGIGAAGATVNPQGVAVNAGVATPGVQVGGGAAEHLGRIPICITP